MLWYLWYCVFVWLDFFYDLISMPSVSSDALRDSYDRSNDKNDEKKWESPYWKCADENARPCMEEGRRLIAERTGIEKQTWPGGGLEQTRPASWFCPSDDATPAWNGLRRRRRFSYDVPFCGHRCEKGNDVRIGLVITQTGLFFFLSLLSVWYHFKGYHFRTVWRSTWRTYQSLSQQQTFSSFNA